MLINKLNTIKIVVWPLRSTAIPRGFLRHCGRKRLLTSKSTAEVFHEAGEEAHGAVKVPNVVLFVSIALKVMTLGAGHIILSKHKRHQPS